MAKKQVVECDRCGTQVAYEPDDTSRNTAAWKRYCRSSLMLGPGMVQQAEIGDFCPTCVATIDAAFRKMKPQHRAMPRDPDRGPDTQLEKERA